MIKKVSYQIRKKIEIQYESLFARYTKDMVMRKANKITRKVIKAKNKPPF